MLDSDDILIRALLQDSVLTDKQVEIARRHAAEARPAMSVLDAVVTLAIAPSRTIAIARAQICECPYADLDAFEIDIHNASALPRAVAERCGAFPLFRLGQTTTIGMIDPLNLRAVDQVRQSIRTDVEIVLCDAEPLRALIARAFSMASAANGDAPRAAEEDLVTGEEPIVAAVNQIIAQAIDEGASDIHIGPDEHELHLRHRIDGVLAPRQGPPLAAHSGIVQRLKVMASLDLTVTRKPQDGKFRFDRRGQPIDVRLSFIPTICGENVVMRLLRPTAQIKGFEDLGLAPHDLETIVGSLDKPHGMILVTGPTGSGKTTTLYTALARLNSPELNIMTIEDPVEIRLPLIRQTQVNAEIGLTFAAALRTILRQDPDVVLVGEVRDAETAQIAVQASLTGHLVLSTLHTNDAVGAVARLRDMGVPPFAINSSLLCVVAQRLVRCVCIACARPEQPDPTLARKLGLKPDELAGFRRGAGCARCSSTGFKGRIGVYETLPVRGAVHDAIEGGAEPIALRRAAAAAGLRPMWRDALDKAKAGLTTIDEAVSVMATIEAEAGAETAPAPADTTAQRRAAA